MTVILWIQMILWTVLAVAAYRLSLADGLSASRRGRLCGKKEERPDRLLEKINAYDGRKESYDQLK